MNNFTTTSLEPSLTKITLAHKILAEFMAFRRTIRPKQSACCQTCYRCTSVHLPKIIAAIEAQQPVIFVLPAFPGKSPNLEKVLGPLPDYAEQLAVSFLNKLCFKIQHYYAPGAQIILCSDGRVFSDIVGMKESDITAYQIALENLISKHQLSNISCFNLDNVYQGYGFEKMRQAVMADYGSSIEALKQRIRNGKEALATTEEQNANRMYRGITRFLFEDSLHSQQTKSRTLIQKLAREKAYQVINRSNAWSNLIASFFPEAVRLSIHPQSCGSKKLGIRLVANESWMTPWHGVALKTGDGHILLKRIEAESLGAELIYDEQGRPSYYKKLELSE